MRNELFDQAVTEILKRYQSYPREAYELLPIVLDYTVRRCHKTHPTGEESQHVSGAQLSYGFRDYMLETYGPFAWDILQAYRILRTNDIGQLVYHLIEVGAFGKTEKDSIQDFDALYDFEQTFRLPFEAKDVQG